MLDEIKNIQGINHDEFDSMIEIWIKSAKLDLKGIGIVDEFVDNPNCLVKTAIITYVLSFLDITNSELYSKSYSLQKDILRHTSEYIMEN